MKAVSECYKLKEINDFPWSKDVLAPGAKELNLARKDLHEESAMVVLLDLLPRVAANITKIELRCLMCLLGGSSPHRPLTDMLDHNNLSSICH